MTDPSLAPLVDLLAARTDMLPQEVLDAVWLLGRVGASADPAVAVAPGGRHDPRRGRDGREPDDAGQVAGPPPGDGSFATLHLPDEHGAGSAAGDPLRLAGEPAIRNRLAITRELRGIQELSRLGGIAAIDETETARVSAEARTLLPVFARGRRRFLELTLVFDRSISMGLWRRTVGEFHDLLQNSGLFRRVDVWGVDTDEREPVLRAMGNWRHGRRAGRSRNPREVASLGGRSAVLLVTDGIGEGWLSPNISDMIDIWSRKCPVAIVQLLPEQLWHRTKVRAIPAQVGSPRPVAPSTSWQISVNPPFEPLAGRLAVPVLALDPDWLGNWFDLVARPWSKPTALKVMPLGGGPVGNAAGGPPPARSGVPHPRVAAKRAPAIVNAFRENASPTAFELACHLSAAPLTPAVMRLVQRAVLPRSSTVHLAEVMLSDLLVRVAWDHDEPLFEFRPGVREELLATLTRTEARRVLAVLADVSDQVTAAFGGTLDFNVLASSEPDQGRVAARLPFARVAKIVLERLGGRYRRLAAQIPATTVPPPAGQWPRAWESWADDPEPFRFGPDEPADPHGSRAVLIGVSRYEQLPPVPAVAGNLAGLAAALQDPDLWGLPAQRCTVLADPDDPREVSRALRQAARETQPDGLLLVYFAGHGLIDPFDGTLLLGLRDTDPAVPYESGLPFAHVRRALDGVLARRSLIVLDCCFSGAADMDPPSAAGTGIVADRAGTADAALLVSAPRDRLAQAPPGEPYTAFTGELLAVLRGGLPERPAILDVHTVWQELTRRLDERGFERPELRSTGDDLPLVRNAARRLAGRILMAAAAAGDPGLDRAVILILRHDEIRGAIGIRIDRPTGDPAPAGTPPHWLPLLAAPAVLFDGGPLGRADGPVAIARLRPGAEPPATFVHLREGLGTLPLSAGPDTLEADLAAVRLFAGYLGWEPGRLESAVADGTLVVTDAPALDALSGRPSQLWASLHARTPEE
ncbi:YqgE/AlgH family protein [Dactylosporangium sp. CA-092794]|uniref:YqgE/AlgH family protein n=1 Tax=Dactylosporangium sp. CA-092794 TaxID=3239929 RepID=UPI003D9287A7